MPTQIPMLQRMQAAAPESVGRLDTQVPDASRAFGNVANAVGGAIRELGETEKQAADVKSNEALNKFESWYNKKLYGDSASGQLGLVHMEGDPTEAYNKFDEEAMQMLDQVAGEDQSWIPGVKNTVKNRLGDKYNSLHNKRLVSYGEQYDKWDRVTTASRVELEKKNVTDSMSYIRPGDASSFQPYEQTIGNIQSAIIDRAVRVGTARRTEDGRIEMDQVVKYEIAKNVSDSTYDGVKNLISANQLTLAKEAMDRYSDRLDPVNKEKLTKAFEDARIEENAYIAVGNVEGKTADQQKVELGRLDEKTQQKAYSLLSARERDKEYLEERDAKQTYEKAYDYYQANLESDRPYTSWETASKDPVYKNMADRMQPKQKEALKNMFDRRKESDADTRLELLEMIDNNKLTGMSGAEFEEKGKSLSKTDYAWFRNQWKNANNMSRSEERAVGNDMARQADEIARGSAMAKYVGRGSQRRLTPASQKRIIEFKTKMREELDNLDLKKMSSADRTKWIQKRLSEELMGKNASGNPALTGSPTYESPRASADVSKPMKKYQGLSADQQSALRAEYRNELQGAEMRFSEFIKWAEDNNKLGQ